MPLWNFRPSLASVWEFLEIKVEAEASATILARPRTRSLTMTISAVLHFVPEPESGALVSGLNGKKA
uniref:Uncharacterized protein n=1 Tax=Chromera velia CCMP2878 TaxID=1169474 RepID=A0A0G4FXF0_9ALVE|eukprot:Cvel_19116.t1-p1 / transcript=Cvel_19116.t1 / gene=Cvel_19116 / organism=Chromera_velia_CCMP2878 / gene_product=hypothetical protein / transcript_product=hypothetical protein / location=Cvel_scaffold1624:11171-11833(+) / protein_length=66 / sequence_SO=supercontig / SO=protein_coding / is_pseudo=false